MEKGRVYEMVYLTEEEKIVVDAMRAGARIKVGFHNVSYEQVQSHTDQLSKKILAKRRIVDFTSNDETSISFINFESENEEGTVRLDHYVHTTKKPPTAIGDSSKYI